MATGLILESRIPYRGLRTFNEEDSPFFFGRADDIKNLATKLEKTSFLAIIGASGSGKSSLIRAGLIPALRKGLLSDSGTWNSHTLKPGAKPLEALAVGLSQLGLEKAMGKMIDEMKADKREFHLHTMLALSKRPAEERAVWVVDQFEEVFTLCRNEEERSSFIDNLLFASSVPGGRSVVLLTMRADFYHRCLEHAELARAIAEHQYTVVAMNEENLRQAIEEPARRVGLSVDPELTDEILAEIRNQPGALPLLEHALYEVWGRRSEGRLTLTAYKESGGVKEALPKRADAIYESLSASQREIARRVMLRLTQPGEGTDDTRRRARMSELVTCDGESEAVSEIVRALADARLLTTSNDEQAQERLVDVSHEALIRGWPRLRQWVEEDRAGLRTLLRLSEAAQEWRRENRDEGLLYRGARLAVALEWKIRNEGKLSVLEREFLACSEGLKAREDEETQAAQRRELEAAQKLAETEKRRAATAQELAEKEKQRAEAEKRSSARLRRFLAGLAVLLVASVILSFIAYTQKQQAETARNEAEHLSYVANMNLAASEFEASNYTRVYELINSYIPAPSANADYRDFLWYLLWKGSHHEKQTLKGHTDAVNTLVWSSDGKTLTSTSRDGTTKFWDVTSGRELRTLKFILSDQVWSGDGKTVAGVGAFGTIKLIDVASGRELRSIPGNSDLSMSLAWSSDGKTLASGNRDGTVKLWDTASGRELRTLSGHSNTVKSLAWSPGGNILASASVDFSNRGQGDSIKLWDAASGRELRTIKVGYIKSLAWSPDGKTMAYGDSQTIKIYDPAGGQEMRAIRGSYYVSSVIWSRDGKTIVSAYEDKTIKLWDAGSGRELRTLRGHSASVESLALSPDGKTLASGEGAYGKDYAIKLWDVDDSSGARTLKGHTDAVTSLAWSPDGKMIASGAGAILGPFGPDRDSSIKIWDAASGQELHALRGHEGSVWSLAWSSDGRTIASGSQDRTIKLWDATDGRALRMLQGHSNAIFSVVWNPDGITLASGGADNTIKIWDAASGRELRTIRVDKSVYSLVWSRDGKTLASGGYDAIRLWDVASGRELRAFFVGSAVFSVDWSRDGKTLASGGSDNGTIKLWDVASGRELRILRGHTGPVNSVAWSLDGKTIASGSDDKTVKLWDVFSGRELASLKGHTRPVLDVAWSSDGKTLASGSYDETIILLSAATDDEVTANAWDQRPNALMRGRQTQRQ